MFDSTRIDLWALLVAATFAGGQANAYTLYTKDGSTLNLDLEIGLGLFNSQNAYAQLRTEASSPTWLESYVKYGLSGEQILTGAGSLYGAFNLVSAANRYDGDAAGFSIGKEEDTGIEDAYIGWRSGDLVPWLGHDGIDLSIGSQTFVIGDGFLISGDLVDYGEGFRRLADTPGGISRGGGAFYIAPRHSFHQTAILRLGGESGLHVDGFWLKTDNVGQAESELAGANLEYRSSTYGTIGTTYIKGLDVDDRAAEFFGLQNRDGQKNWAVRGRGSLGVENLEVAGEYVDQDNGKFGDAHSWYAEAGWTFSDLLFSPNLKYRFSSFSNGYDPLFYGFQDFGTWYQGEVAGNYAGPYSSDTDIQHVGLTVTPFSNLTLGALFFDFSDTPNGAHDARETDIYAAWTINKHFTIYPLIGLYNPDKSASEGGTQIGDADTNIYTQIFAILSF